MSGMGHEGEGHEGVGHEEVGHEGEGLTFMEQSSSELFPDVFHSLVFSRLLWGDGGGGGL